MEQIIEEQQAHRAQVAAISSQMQIQAMEKVEVQEKELQRLSVLLEEHQAVLRSSPERPHQEPPQPTNLSQLRCGFTDYLPGTVNITRGATTRAGQVSHLGRPPIVKRDTFEDILADAEVPITLQRWVQFANMATSTSVLRPLEHPVERTPHFGVSQVPPLMKACLDTQSHRRICLKKALAIVFKQWPQNSGN